MMAMMAMMAGQSVLYVHPGVYMILYMINDLILSLHLS